MKIILIGLILIVGYGCSKATSDPVYKFKKATESGVAAKTNGVEVSHKELMNGIEAELYDAEMKIFEIKFNRVKELLIERLIKNDPKAKGLSNDEYFDKFITSKIKISEKEVNEFVKERKIPPTQVNPQIIEKIKGFLSMQKKEEAVSAWLAEKTGESGIEVYFQKPQRPSFDVDISGSPFFGGKDAKVTIVEFSDFQCPYCAEGAKILKQLKSKYGSKIKVVMKQFPLPFHTRARAASNAVLCINEQGSDKFWKMHDELFADQSKLSEKDFKALAAKLGSDEAKFEKCLTAKTFDKQVQSDIDQGKALGVKSTPTFFVNGQLVRGALPIKDFSEIIDQQLSL